MKSIRNISWAVASSILCLNIHLITPTIASAQTQTTTTQNSQVTSFQTLAEADKLYLLGKKAEAEQLYRQAKAPFSAQTASQAQPITDPKQLSGTSQVYWRTAQEGLQQNLDTKVFVPLQMLIEKQPEFVSAYTLLAETLEKRDRHKESLAVLEKAVNQFPDSAELTLAQVKALEADKQWIEASIAARSFAIVYPNRAQSPELLQSAEKNLKRFRKHIKEERISTGIIGGIVGIFTGRTKETVIALGPLLLQGESKMGSQLANEHKKQARLIEDPEIVEYVDKIGQDVAKLMGRDFKYEFYVVQDNAVNAFALPGGKVFVNTGAILGCNSEAELAGLLAHEVSHSVLSHGYQSVVERNLLANLKEVIPLGNIVATIANAQYSQAKERQSDILATRAIATAGYAADGLRNVMNSLKQQERQSLPVYLATHPTSDKRIEYLEKLIEQNGYNRYAFEGVEKHAAIAQKVREFTGQ